jgi:O-succinylbenzoate synthase
VYGLEWSQVDPKRGVALVHADQAKARRAIGVPLNEDAVAVVGSSLESTCGASSLARMAGRSIPGTPILRSRRG